MGIDFRERIFVNVVGKYERSRLKPYIIIRKLWSFKTELVLKTKNKYRTCSYTLKLSQEFAVNTPSKSRIKREYIWRHLGTTHIPDSGTHTTMIYTSVYL